MQYKTIFRLLGILLLIFGQSMLTPLLINAVFQEGVWSPFIIAYLFTEITGLGLWLTFIGNRGELKIRDGFLLVVLFWVAICLFASIPLLLTIDTLPSITDAIFESVSGITTTGASVIKDLDSLPHAILFYRQQLQFIGGIGIVILAVAILPMLGVGGMQLFQAETPGPMKDNKLTPRITQTAKAIWSIYLLLTMLCALCYFLAGMDWFEALAESFGTVSTGGFALHNSSFGSYKSDLIRSIACVFMLLGGTNFALHFFAIKKRTLQSYRNDEEFRFYLGLILAVGILVSYTFIKLHPVDFNLHVIVNSFFTSISLVTTTGLEVDTTSSWRSFTPFLGILLMVIGGCAASTSGGLKVLRVLLIYKQSKREIGKVLHPQAIIPIKLGDKRVSDNTIQSVWGFVSVFLALYLLFSLVFMWRGFGLYEAFAMVGATITNSGFGLDILKPNFLDADSYAKWLLIMIMLVGRLEVFSILILFTRGFWRK